MYRQRTINKLTAHNKLEITKESDKFVLSKKNKYIQIMYNKRIK